MDEFDQFPDAPMAQQATAAPAQAATQDEFADFPDAPSASASAPSKPSLINRYLNGPAGALGPVGTGEAVANLASGMVAAPVSGLAGLGAAATNAVGLTDVPIAQVVDRVGGALTYEPRTGGGKMAANVASWPFQKIAQGADAAGDLVNTAVPSIGSGTMYSPGAGGWPVGGSTASPLAATAVNVGVQALPSLLFRGRAGKANAGKLTDAEVAAEAGKKAKEYVSARTSLDWDRLAAPVKERLTQIAKDSGNLDLLDAAAIERQAALESLPVPVTATRGQLTRDPVQLRNEGNVSATEAGKPIRDTHVAQTQALLQNLDVLKGKVSGTGAKRATAETPEQVGLAVQDTALRAKADASKRKYDFLYKKARATEPDAAVTSAPLQNMLERNPELQHLGFMQGWFKKAGIDGPTKQVRLSELQDLREKASGIARTGGTDGYYAGKVVGAIDEAMTQVPAASKAWKDAQQAFKKHKTEFEEQGAVEKLVTDKSRTDRSTALENTWKQVVQAGSIEDLRKVKRSLLTGEDVPAKQAGAKAWRDIRAQTVQHIINEATKSVTRYEDGTPNLTPASMERAIKSIGPDKLREIFGDSTVRQLNQIMEATRTVKTEPPVGFKGSPTLANTIALLEKSIGKVPFLGDTISGTVKSVANLKDLGSAQRDIRRAQSTPLDEAVKRAGQSRIGIEQTNMLRRNAGAVTATQRERRQ